LLRTSLVSVAMLKVNYDLNNRDYIDYLIPFTSDVLSGLKGKQVVVDLVKKEIAGKYGLSLPRGTIELCLKRMAKRGHLVREDGRYLVSENLPDSDIDTRRAGARRDADVVVHALKAYAELQGRPMDDSQAYSTFVKYLKQ